MEWDLQNGTFLIGKSTSDYNFFWDGQTLRMRNVDIDLKNNSDYKDLQRDVDSRINQLDNDVTSRLDSYSQEFKISEGKVNSTISSVRTELAKYDTKDEVDAKIMAADNSIKTYVTNNFSSISQTDRKIETNVSSLSSRLGSAESKITQTSNEVSSKVSKNGVISAINQSAESVKIKASKIDLQGNVNLTGEFLTYNGYGKAVHLHDQELDFWQSYKGSSKLGTLGIIKNYYGGDYRLDWRHDTKSALSLSYQLSGSSYMPYVTFDKFKHVNSYSDENMFLPRLADITVHETVGFQRDVKFRDVASFKRRISIGVFTIEDRDDFLEIENEKTGRRYFFDFRNKVASFIG